LLHDFIILRIKLGTGIVRCRSLLGNRGDVPVACRIFKMKDGLSGIGIVVLLIASLLHVAQKAAAGDAIRGPELAAIWCRSCHLPGENRPASFVVAPPLEEVAQRSGVDAKHIAQLLLSPHPAMPDRGLSRDEADDIAAYLLSLQR
jgi:mono/diheme cytochrome c family protein